MVMRQYLLALLVLAGLLLGFPSAIAAKSGDATPRIAGFRDTVAVCSTSPRTLIVARADIKKGGSAGPGTDNLPIVSTAEHVVGIDLSPALVVIDLGLECVAARSTTFLPPARGPPLN